MRQVLQNLGNGETKLEDVPAPRATANTVIVASRSTLISAGSERMLVDFGRASLLSKAKQQPERVRQVLDKVLTDGLMTTYEGVRSKLDQPLALGYCNAGVVIEAGSGVTDFRPGDRVVSNGSHAELVRVPANLCARIPDGLSDETASFTVLGAIGLQGVRLAQPTIGETVVVIGQGLIGLMTAQILVANGCRVLGIDVDASKLELARRLGIEVFDPKGGGDVVATALAFSEGRGVDAVIITASTPSNDPMAQAARMCRKRGKVVLVGVVGLELNRADFYEKEITFQVSCSYGPGRYDPAYEEQGQDYPLGFVRWTAQRNFEAILSLMKSGRIDVGSLISHRFDFDRAIDAYEVLTSDKSALGIMLSYPDVPVEKLTERRVTLGATPSYAVSSPVLGFIGAGNYASRILIPAFKAAGAQLDTIVTTGGPGGVHHGRKSGFAAASTDSADVMKNPAMNTVVVVTRHNTHANYVIEALRAGKNVFVEKPLALTLADVDAVERACNDAAGAGAGAPRLMVGFNRRFAPLVQTMKELIGRVAAPKAFTYTCNAGAIPPDHWTQDMEVGGGRIIGEACHFIDLLRYLAGSKIVDAQLMAMQGQHDKPSDTAVISLRFEDGSIGTIQYFANGGKRFPKERIEAFAGGAVLQLDNFLSLKGYGWAGFSRRRLWRQDKGQTACAAAFLDAIKTGSANPIPLDEILEIARTTINVANQQQDRTADLG